MKAKTIFLGLIFSTLCVNSALIAQQRAFLHIDEDGKQEAIPLRRGEKTKDALSRLEKRAPYVPQGATGVRDSLTNFGKNGFTYFNAFHQDVMFQWFDPEAGGFVREFGWRNGADIGTITKSTIRAWNADNHLLTLPKTFFCVGCSPGRFGYYKDSNDGDGLKTPFREEATDTHYVDGKFDPLGKEANWLIRGRQFALVANAWQSFKLLDFGDTMKFNAHEPIGFTKQNDAKISDIGGGDVNMLLAANGIEQWPYHSFKFYEGTPTSNYGWVIRDYEWNMYVIVEFTTDRPPKIKSWDRLAKTLKTTPRTITAIISDDNPGGGAAGLKSVDLFAKINSGAFVKSPMTGVESNFTGTLPAANPGDTVTYYIVAADVNDLSTTSATTSYTIFKVTKSYLLMWNGRGLPGARYAKYYMLRDSITEKPWFDVWDVKSYGKAEIPDLLLWYNGVVEATGDGGYADLSALAGAWLATGTVANPKAWFWSDQDHGFISGYADTTFDDADPHAKYFGVKALINQDYPYWLSGSPATGVTKPWRLDYVGGAGDPAFGFITAAMAKDTSTLWYNPNFEWGFQNWMDQLTPTASAVALFKDKKTNTIVNGVRNTAADKAWATVWLAFDYASVDFLGDTSKIPTTYDKKYKWMFYDVKNPATLFIKQTTGISKQPVASVPDQFSLAQNYPNPFNPVTVISYQLAVNSFVTVRVYDILGRDVATLVNEAKPAGSHRAQWDATHFASGVYFYRLQAGNFSDAKKLLLLK